jgi:hypothetical protein
VTAGAGAGPDPFGAPSGAAWSSGWSTDWLGDPKHLRADLWRGVEAQHRIATMKVVDSLAEQDLLEDLLEQSKPPLPPDAAGTHYLLATPYRYVSGWASRFRAPGEPGIWYGAERLETACAEVGYWRWRFAMDSDALRDQAVLSEHTFFRATVAGPVVDLCMPPWTHLAHAWMDPADYSRCHALARAARSAGAAWIRYASVRDPGHGPCGAVLSLQALSLGDLTHQQTWACKATAGAVLMRPLGVAARGAALAFAFG